MGIEKITGGNAVPYQGSAAAVATPASPEPVVQIPEQTAQTTQTVTAAQPQSYSFQKTEEGSEAQKERTETQSQNTQLKNAVNDFNKQMKDSEAIFGIHEKTNRLTIKIVDKTTKKVIKEYPPEQTLDMIAKVWEIAGILVDEKR